MDATANDRAFIDTNIFVYAFDRRDSIKQELALNLLRASSAGSVAVSTQVLSEFYWSTTRRLPSPLSSADALRVVERLARLTLVIVDGAMIRDAILLGSSTSVAFWDALIVKAASSAGCSRLLTEDLNHGQIIDGVEVVNPFVNT